MRNLYPHLTRAFETTVVEKKGNYPYPISPFSGVTKPITSQMLAEVERASLKEKVFSEATLIVTFESAGNQLAATVSRVLNLPYLIARKKKFSLPHEISFSVTTNYDEKNFYLYGNVKGKKILIIDDVIASGTTVKNSILALQKAGAEVVALFAVAGKLNLVGKRYQDTLREISITLTIIVQIKVIGNKVEVL